MAVQTISAIHTGMTSDDNADKANNFDKDKV